MTAPRIAAVALTALVLASGTQYAHATTVKPRTTPGTYVPPTPTTTVSPSGTIRINSDMHDGETVKIGDKYYMYGTAYGCGFTWRVANTPFCGFWASSADSLAGPWTTPVELFNPTGTDPYSGLSWQDECDAGGNGCFNARMLNRTGWGADDGVNILWFNSPHDGENSYNALGCTGPLGPCGVGAPVYGSYHKPNLYKAYGNGDFGFINTTAGPVLVDSIGSHATMATEQIDKWGVNGTAVGTNPAFPSSAEGVGGWYDTGTGKFVWTYSDPQCGYCTGAAAGYATSATSTGVWDIPGNLGFNPPPAARRDFSDASCGGQPRTVTVIDGQPYEDIDLWTGSMNETVADTLLVPLHMSTTTPSVPGDGQPYVPPVSFGSCT